MINHIIQGNSLVEVSKLESNSIQCCVTSPPYFGLRDYGKDAQIGREKTVEDYLHNIVTVFREVRRVLKPDGTLWVNLGDSYASGWSCARRNVVGSGKCETRVNRLTDGLKEKDLMGISWRVAFALQSDGWYLRQDIIWNKPNVMPESVKDRCTKSHEYIFLLSKSPKYYYDHESIKEDSVQPNRKRNDIIGGKSGELGIRHSVGGVFQGSAKRNKRSVWTVNTKPYREAHFATFPKELIVPCILAGSREGDVILDPFMGSGTVAEVACDLNRQYLGIELNPEYVKLIEKRLSGTIHSIME